MVHKNRRILCTGCPANAAKLSENYQTREYKSHPHHELGIDYKQTAVTDFTGVARLEQIKDSIDFIKKHRDMNQNVYIHCKAGRYRSALMTACYLIHQYQMTPEEARDRLKGLRSIVILDNERQMAAMNEYYDHLYKKF